MVNRNAKLDPGIDIFTYQTSKGPVSKYRVRITYGKRKESLGLYYDIGSARAALRDAKNRVKDGNFIPPSELRRRAIREQEGYSAQAVRVADHAAVWLESMSLGMDPKTPATITSYRSTLNKHIIPALGNRYLIDVNQHAVDKLIAQVRKESGEGAARNVARTLKSLFYHAIKNGVGGISELPFKLHVGKPDKRADDSVPLPSEVTKAASFMPPGLRLAPLVAATCALRPGETLGLQRGDFMRLDSDTPTLLVRRTWNQKTRPPSYTLPKGGKTRNVSIPLFLVPQIRQHLDEFVGSEPDAPVFVSPKNRFKPIGTTTYANAWKRALNDANMPPFVLHSLRHLGLTLLVLAGATQAEVMHRAGHTDMEAAGRYQHPLRGRDRELISAFGEAWEQGQ